MVFSWPKNEQNHCVGTVIGKRFAITAAQCFRKEKYSTVPFDVEIYGYTYTVEEVRINNCYDHKGDFYNSADMAIMVFSEDIYGIPYKVYNAKDSGSEVRKDFTLMGWGSFGKVGQGFSDNIFNEGDSIFHRGQNVFEDIEKNTLVYEMDEFGLELEAIAHRGDRGGPALIKVCGADQIAGVNVGGECCSYGDEDEYARLGSSFAYEWIAANTVSSTKGFGEAVSDCNVWKIPDSLEEKELKCTVFESRENDEVEVFRENEDGEDFRESSLEERDSDSTQSLWSSKGSSTIAYRNTMFGYATLSLLVYLSI